MRLVRLCGDGRPRWAVLTPVATYLVGGGIQYSQNGPINVFGKSLKDAPPRVIATISQPWAVVDFETYEAMEAEE